MPLGIERYERMLKGVVKKSESAIRAELEGNVEENVIEALKQSFTNVSTILHRKSSSPDVDAEEIRRNKVLFKKLLNVAEERNLDLSDLKNDLIDRLTRDLDVLGKSGKSMDDKKHPLYKMGMAFIKYDKKAEIKKEAIQIGGDARAAMKESSAQHPPRYKQEKQKGRGR
jgi:hypothetical protein